MSKTFSSFSDLANHILNNLPNEAIALHYGLHEACQVIEKKARDKFGVYQKEMGPFERWQELAESTKDERERLGYTPDEPLLRSGELRDSIGYEVHLLEGIVGSTSDIMVYQELGTEHIPPRAVLGPAALSCQAKVKQVIGSYAMAGILGGSLMSPGFLHAHTLTMGEDYESDVL